MGPITSDEISLNADVTPGNNIETVNSEAGISLNWIILGVVSILTTDQVTDPKQKLISEVDTIAGADVVITDMAQGLLLVVASVRTTIGLMTCAPLTDLTVVPNFEGFDDAHRRYNQ